MNTQLVESLAEKIRALSTAEQNALWQKLDYAPTTENSLLQKIAETLPTVVQQRYNELRAKLQAETLTLVEHQELLELIDVVEQFDADRLQHLLALAQLRQIPLPELLIQLKISPPRCLCLDATSRLVNSRQLSIELRDAVNTANVRWIIHHNLLFVNTLHLSPKAEKHL